MSLADKASVSILSTTTTATAIWHKQNSDFTIDYEKHAMMELVNSTLADVCFKERLTEAQMMDPHIENEVNWDTIANFNNKLNISLIIL